MILLVIVIIATYIGLCLIDILVDEYIPRVASYLVDKIFVN